MINENHKRIKSTSTHWQFQSKLDSNKLVRISKKSSEAFLENWGGPHSKVKLHSVESSKDGGETWNSYGYSDKHHATTIALNRLLG